MIFHFFGWTIKLWFFIFLDELVLNYDLGPRDPQNSPRFPISFIALLPTANADILAHKWLIIKLKLNPKPQQQHQKPQP